VASQLSVDQLNRGCGAGSDGTGFAFGAELHGRFGQVEPRIPIREIDHLPESARDAQLAIGRNRHEPVVASGQDLAFQ
jgi:hypothetical protein